MNTPNVHDKFTKSVFQIKENMIDLLQNALPAEIYDQIDTSNIRYSDNLNAVELNYYGVYFDCKPYKWAKKLAEKYYLQSADLKYITAMNNLGHYYKKIRNYNQMKKYMKKPFFKKMLKKFDFLSKMR